VTTYDAPRAEGRPPTARAARPPGSGALFDEQGFAWPEPPNPKREAKLPWFHFHDVHEARDYLWSLGVMQVLGILLLINGLFIKNPRFGWPVFLGLIVVQVVHRRIWYDLCKRASPPPGRWHKWTIGVGNLRMWQCVAQARAMLQDR
jgi:hypothetical protein